ncbi:MAG: glycosyltransferase family 4 protein [Verrucomicrobiales bacterium]|nr:glycosyltransferase family 4 protein [Verrucomicrobiales bacterium]
MHTKTFCLAVPWMALGGADRCGLDLLKLYSRRGWRTIVIASSHNEYRHRKRTEFESVADKIYYGKDAAPFLCRERPAVIVINNSHEAYLQIDAIRQASPQSHISCLIHMILPAPWDFESSIKRFEPFIDSVVTISRRLKDELVTFGIDANLITPIHWFGFESVPVLENVTTNRPVIVCPFRLHKQKRPEFVIDIAAAFRRLGGDALFKFVGDGAEERNVRRRAGRFGVEEMIEFCGCQDFADMPRYYAEAKALLCPSIDEGIPLAYFEAMQCSLPLAVSNVGAVAELVPAFYLIDLRCEREEMKYARLLQNHLQSRSSHVSEIVRKRVAGEFSHKVWARRISGLYR